MKSNYLKIFLVLTLFMMSFFGTAPVTSNNNLTEGTSFQYHVNKYNINAKVNTTEINIDSFSVAGSANITPGTSDANFNVTYTGSNSNSVSYNVSKGTYSENATVLNDTLDSSLLASPTTTTPGSDISASNDIATESVPFILPVSGKSDPLWEFLDNTTFPDSSVSLDQGGLKVSGTIKSKITSDHFEVSVDTKFSGSLFGAQVDMKILAHLIYELATGVLLGYKADISINTSGSGTTASETANIEITRSDYNFSSSGVFGFEYMPFIFSMFMVSIIILKLRKNKIVK